jgi:hypothetical protein
MLAVNLDAERAEFVGENVFIPIDELLGYIIDRHFTDPAERRWLQTSVLDARQRRDEVNRNYESTVGRVGTLYLICKSCGATLKTHHKGIEGQRLECPLCEVSCTACGWSDVYDGSDLKLKLAGA